MAAAFSCLALALPALSLSPGVPGLQTSNSSDATQVQEVRITRSARMPMSRP